MLNSERYREITVLTPGKTTGSFVGGKDNIEQTPPLLEYTIGDPTIVIGLEIEIFS